jgi:hypothetical protein
MSAVVILGETPDGLLLLSAGDGDQLTGAQILWLIGSGRHLRECEAKRRVWRHGTGYCLTSQGSGGARGNWDQRQEIANARRP